MSFPEEYFRSQVQRSLDAVKRILHVNRKPIFAADVQHQYQDKYILTEMLSNMAIVSTFNSLQNCGVDDTKLQLMLDWAETRSVSLSLRSAEMCKFVRKTTRDVDSATKHVTQGLGMSLTSKSVTTITEYFWKFDVTYEIVCYRGTGESVDDVFTICHKEGSTEIKTTVDQAPRPEVVARNAIDVNVTALLQKGADGDRKPFAISRDAPHCHTPRRNADVEKLMSVLANLGNWCRQVHSYFTGTLFPVEQEHGLDLNAINCGEVFVPVVPLMNDVSGSESESSVPAILPVQTEEPPTRTARVRRMGSQDLTTTSDLPAGGLPAVCRAPEVVLGLSDISLFLAEESRSLTAKCEQMDAVFPSRTATAAVITAAEARLLVTLLHAQEVCCRYAQGVDYIENMLRKQLVAAIGKEVQPSDFSAYMRFHNNKIFLPQYRPKPFCYAVRRSTEHAPEGVVSIEEQPSDGSIAEPIYTLASSSPASNTMKFSLSAAAEVSFGGSRHLHAYLLHKFTNEVGMGAVPPQLTLRAEARQFSSYIVLIGRISSSTSFDPKYAMIVQNKDEISIPLELETIPSAKEFKDAISSLSPEQQRFAKAFRGMQLESTLFGVLVIQIKPQLEKVLNLPPDSLTKEIRLTQDLMELFIRYQIPSDLMSFDGEEASSVKEKLDSVKEHVAALRDMINSSKEKEISDKKLETRFDNGDMLFDCFSGGAPPPPCAPTAMAMSSAPVMPMRRLAAKSVARSAPAPAPPNQQSAVPTQSATSAPRTYGEESSETSAEGVKDYTQLPRRLDSKLEALDKEGSVRPTIITAGDRWTKKAKKSLLADMTTSNFKACILVNITIVMC